MGAPSELERPASRLARLRWQFLAGAAGACLTLAIWVLMSRGEQATIPLTRQELEAAAARWAERAPDAYDLTVVVSTRRRETYHVVVRKSEVRSVERDGRPLTSRRVWDTWTVPGMLRTLEMDLASVERVASGDAEPNTPQLDLRITFDPEFGYPRLYQRTEKRKFGSNVDATWEVKLVTPRQ